MARVQRFPSTPLAEQGQFRLCGEEEAEEEAEEEMTPIYMKGDRNVENKSRVSSRALGVCLGISRIKFYTNGMHCPLAIRCDSSR